MATQLTQVTFPSGDYIDLSGKVSKSGDIMTGTLIVPKTRIANTCYGVSFGRTTATPVETILYTGIKWVSGAHMPVIHITGYAYGLKSPVEFKIGFYIYNNTIGWCGVTNMGAWRPDVYLFKYTRDSINYVAVGLAGSCYFLQLQADIQDEMGKFNNISMDDANWSWEFLTDTGHIPTSDAGVTCIQVPYKADILGLDKLPLAGGQMTGTIITPKNDAMGIRPNTNNWGEVGDSNYYFYKAYVTNYYGAHSYVNNWASNGNIGASATSSAAATRGYVNFYNECAPGGTQTKTTLYGHTDANANINILLPKTSGTLALASTTLAGYGITDAKIASGTITLGSNTITPLTSSSTLNATKLSGTIPSSCYTDTNNAVTQTVTDIGNATYELLFSGTADNTTRTEGARKSQYATFNPSKTAFTFGTRLSGSTVGNYSHAEGLNTTASGDYSHAKGGATTASGSYSYAEGYKTIANHKSQHVFGEYNEEDPSTEDSNSRGEYIEIVGKGNSYTRSNARTLDWSGNEVLAGTLTTLDVIHPVTWDGTNTSLKTAISAVNNKVDSLDERLSLDIADFYGNQTTVASGTSVKNIGSFKNTTAGRYMIIVSVIWSGNANGYRVAYLSDTSTGTNIDRFAVDSRMAVNGEQTIQGFSEIIWMSANTTYYITGKQNSGSSLTAYWGVKAVRIPH